MGIKELNETHDPYLRSEAWEERDSDKFYIALMVGCVLSVAVVAWVLDLVVMAFFKWWD